MGFSEILFYGGIIAMAGTAIISVIVVLLAIKRKKQLQKKLNAEYGEGK